MGIVKGTAEDISVMAKAAGKIRAWASRSSPKVLLILALAGVLVVGAQALYLSWLLQKSNYATQAYIKNTGLLSEKLGYETAIDAITACLESRSESRELHSWYCDRADLQFKRNSNQLKYPGAQEMLQMHAYLAMRNLMRGRVRGLELDQQKLPANTPNGKILDAIVSKTGTVVALVTTALLLIGVFAYLSWPRQERSE